ncbi:hypothetical protein R1sor_009055 [Riccia sorocarpa]|uniref:Reverse transcriptase domain-containing protein n=1 Tax=Riccia sorocarpa TaxID=122646 RepID=A0ABD3H6K7_9MARC
MTTLDIDHRSTFFKADPRVLDSADLKRAIDEIWLKHRGGSPLDSPERYLLAWREVRAAVKNAQYLESRQLSSLEEKKKKLVKLADGLDGLGESSEEFSQLSEEVRRLEVIRDGSTSYVSGPGRGKVPGMDGFSYEALQKIWDRIGEDFTAMMGACWSSGSFPACFLEGVIMLIPKDLRPESLHQWRPIALLPVHYKLLAKVLASRLSLLLPRIVPVQQQGFIRGRGPHACILNLLLAHESLKKSRKQAGFLMLDLEKAYDRLSLDFLWDVLRKLDFGEKFISILQGLASGAVAKVQVNSSLTLEFPLQHGVRQGCPLAPLLFALSSIPFIMAVQKQSELGTVKTVKLPGGAVLDVSALADDTALYLAIQEPTFQVVFGLLDIFQSASEAAINWRKTKLMLIGKYCQPPPWMQHLRCQVLGKSEMVKHLGVPVATAPRPQDVWVHTLAAVGRRIQALQVHKVSFEGRTVLLKVLVQSKLSYLLSFLHLRNSQLKTIKQLFRWHGRSRDVFLLLSEWGSALKTPMIKRLLSAWAEIQYKLSWNPADVVLPSTLPCQEMLTLLLMGGFISPDEHSGGIGALAPILSNQLQDIFELQFSGSPQQFALLEKLRSFPTLMEDFQFLPSDGCCSGPETEPFWGLEWPLQQWLYVFRLLWLKGVPRRDNIFFWRVLFNVFFTGAIAARIRHSDIPCRDCGGQSEDVAHVMISCPMRRELWRSIGDSCRPLAVIASSLEEGKTIPEILSCSLPLPLHVRLSLLLVLVQGFRACWKRRCQLLFDGSAAVLSWGTVMVSAIEILSAQAKRAGPRRKRLLRDSLELLISSVPSPPHRFLTIYQELCFER